MLEHEVLPVARDVSRTSLHQFTSQRTKLTKIEINSQWLPTVTIQLKLFLSLPSFEALEIIRRYNSDFFLNIKTGNKREISLFIYVGT